ncbi:hypothetical protein CGRA01v4_03353 [Colletotrichum graminicola]|nr:hypothetical protein CGRA01v4_03353 [Colletotrichum graminicola]
MFILICCTRIPPLYGKQYLTSRADPSLGSRAVILASRLKQANYSYMRENVVISSRMHII